MTSKPLRLVSKPKPAPKPVDAPESILDAAESARRRDEGMARALRAADVRWKAAAYQAVVTLALRQSTFTADDLWVELKNWKPREPRALGPLMNRARGDKIIVTVDEHKKTAQVTRNRGDVRIWISCIYPGDGES